MEGIMKQKIYNTLYGAIVGDALGVPVEFKDRDYLKHKPVKDMFGYGTYGLPKGSWSDDSSMMLCLADSIGTLKGIDYDDIMKRFASWLFHHKYTPDHKTFDCGRTCSKAICNFKDGIPAIDCGCRGEKDNGNGSLMRIAPLPFYIFQLYGDYAMANEEAFELIHNISGLTHAHKISLIGCDIYCSVMIEILKGRDKEHILRCALPNIGSYTGHHPDYNKALSAYDRITHQSFKNLQEKEIKSSGYVVDTLEAALWCFLNSKNYADCVLKAVNLGYDTDTVACVAGSIAGLYYGNIPDKWISELRNKKLINKVLGKFTQHIEYDLKPDSVLVDEITERLHETDLGVSDLNNGLYPVMGNNTSGLYFPRQSCILIDKDKIIRDVNSQKEAEKIIRNYKGE